MIIGTRGSALALVQSRGVCAQLKELGFAPTLKTIVTQGDRVTHLSLDKLEGKGFFTTEIEQALRAKSIDVAVHSLKDLPAENAAGLVIAASPERREPHDVLIIRPDSHAPDAPGFPVKHHAVIGTSAIRRKAQLASLRPDVGLLDLRGNVPTRLRRLREGVCDAIVIAQAGISRLNAPLEDLVAIKLDPTVFVPAPGQGALALQCRNDDPVIRQALERLHDAKGAQLIQAERLLLRLLEAGCHVPLGAHARFEADHLVMTVFFGGDIHAHASRTRRAHHFTVMGADAVEVATKAWQRLGAPKDIHPAHTLSRMPVSEP